MPSKSALLIRCILGCTTYIPSVYEWYTGTCSSTGSVAADSRNEESSGPVTHRIEALEKQVVHLNATVQEMHKLWTKVAQETFRIAGSSVYENSLRYKFCLARFSATHSRAQ